MNGICTSSRLISFHLVECSPRKSITYPAPPPPNPQNSEVRRKSLTRTLFHQPHLSIHPPTHHHPPTRPSIGVKSIPHHTTDCKADDDLILSASYQPIITHKSLFSPWNEFLAARHISLVTLLIGSHYLLTDCEYEKLRKMWITSLSSWVTQMAYHI